MSKTAHSVFKLSIGKWVILLAMAGLSTSIYPQQADSILSKPVTINIKESTIYNALNRIGEHAGCYFIYDSKDVKSDKKVRYLDCNNIPLRDILNKLLSDPSLEYRVIEEHILIFRENIGSKQDQDTGTDSSGFTVIGGKVFDKDSRSPLPFVTIVLEKLGLGTISNYDGVFSLRVPRNSLKSNVVVSHLGYQSLSVPVELIVGKSYSLYISPRYIPIQEVIIRNIDARGIVKATVEKRAENYSNADAYITSFYREGVMRSNRYTSYSEAVFKIFKSSYDMDSENDQVRLMKSRKLELTNGSDTLSVKLKAGIKGALDLDIIKSLPDFLDPELMDNYTYTKSDIVAHDSRSAYAIAFEQKPEITQPLFSGTLYVDVETLALLGAEFGVNPRYVGKSANLFVLKKDRKINVKPEDIKYSVEYRQWNGKYYIHHIRGDLTFRVKGRRQLFASTYSLFFEFVGIQMDTINVSRFPRREVLQPNIVFSEGKYTYDPKFWGDLNIISPEDDISKAISKINPKIESFEGDLH